MEIVEADRDPVAHRLARTRRRRRLFLPTFVVLVIAAAAVGSSWFAYVENRKGAREIARTYVDAVDTRIREKVDGYFAPAQKVTEIIAASLRSAELRTAERRQLDRISRSYLTANPQILNIYVGVEDGSFLMTSRTDGDGWTRKLVARSDGAPKVTLSDLASDGEVISSREDPNDAYDPRTRSWFQAALATDRPVWSPVYRFFSNGGLGITVSRRFGGDDGPAAVVGVDILLDELESFLDGLTLGDRGLAFIVDGDGYFVVAPGLSDTEGDGSARLKIDDVDIPVLRQVYDRFLIEREFSGLFRVDGAWYMASFSSLRDVLGRDWWLIFTIPESALIGFVETSNVYSLSASAVVAVLAFALLGVVATQSLATDRRARLLERETRRLREAEEAYAELARICASSAPGRALRAATELTMRMTGARRAGIWRLNDAGTRLACLDRFDAEPAGHEAGAHVEAETCPRLFERLRRGQSFTLGVVGENPSGAEAALAEIERAYPGAGKTRVLVSAPILVGGRPAGAVWIEDQAAVGEPVVDPAGFADAVAGHIAPALANFGADGGARPAVIETSGPRLPRDGEASNGGDGLVRAAVRRVASGERALAERGVSSGEAAEYAFRSLAVASVEFHDPVLLGARGPGGGPSLLHMVAERAAGESEVGYARLLGRRLILADDGAGDARAAAARIAGLALDMQGEIAAVRRGEGADAHRCAVSIGLDLGSAFGERLGETGALNLWGDAIDAATALAGSVAEDCVLATEPMAELIADGFVLHGRGGYYVAGAGEIAVSLVQARR